MSAHHDESPQDTHSPSKTDENATMSPLFLDPKTKKAMESIAPILESFAQKTSASENTSLKLPPPGVPESGQEENVETTLQRTFSINSQPSVGAPNSKSRSSSELLDLEGVRSNSSKGTNQDRKSVV